MSAILTCPKSGCGDVLSQEGARLFYCKCCDTHLIIEEVKYSGKD